MATIKEVARLAGVSLGTVSNVLNGKTQNEELIAKVESAMKQLSYRPDANARSLKNTRTNTIGLVLPDVFQNQYKEFLMELEDCLREQGYSLLTKFSRNNRLMEKKSIEAFLELRVDGILVYSNLKQKRREEWAKTKTPMVLISHFDASDFIGDSIILDYKQAFQSLLADLKRRGCRRPGLVLPHDLMEETGLREIYLKFYEDCGLLKTADGSRERGFQAGFELQYGQERPDAVIAGSRDIGEGIIKANEVLGIRDLPVYALKDSCWLDDMGVYEGTLSISQRQAARTAVGFLLEAVKKSQFHERRVQTISARYIRQSGRESGIRPVSHDLHFAMYDCSSARSLEMLTGLYERETGKRVFFDRYSYDDLEQMLYRRSREKDSYYDGFMIDITWMEGMVESGFVKNLDHLLENREYLEGFIEGAVRDYGMYVESLFALPFMSGTQILFYQKDLFEDRALQISYRRKYGIDLKPPASWNQFNSVAEFFTRSCNPNSPVEYGVSMPRGENVYTAIDFLERLWAFGGSVFDNRGNVSIRSVSTENALQSMLTSYQYSSGRNLSSWNEIASEFSTGKSAMVILYNSDVGDVNNNTRSSVTGNLGYAMIPGGTPVMGGWSLGLNRYGKHLEEAEQFLLWACGSECSIPLTLLGGSTLRREYYERSDLETLEPWKRIVAKSSLISRKRQMPDLLDESSWKNTIYTHIIPREIMRAAQGEITETEAVECMEKAIREFICEH